MEPSAPTAAASCGVARPNRIAPSTDRIRNASGKNDVSSSPDDLGRSGTSVCSFGSFGRELRIDHCAPDHVDDVQAGEQEARQERRRRRGWTTDTLAVAPYRISMMLGGMRMPRQPPAQTTPADSLVS